MGNLLSSSNTSTGYSQQSLGYGSNLQCCDEVVDPISLLTVIGAITAASLFLRQAVIDNNVMGAGRRKRDLDINLLVKQGKSTLHTLCYSEFLSPLIFRLRKF